MSNRNERIRIGERVSIQQRGKKRLWVADFSQANRHRRQSLRTANRKLAERKARELDVQLTGGTFTEVLPKTKIADAIDAFIESKRIDGLATRSLAKYRSELTNFAAFLQYAGATELFQLTATLHDRYRAKRLKEVKAITAHTDAVIHKTFTRWCESRDLIAADPLRKVRLCEPARMNKHSPDLATINRLLAAAAERDPILEAKLAALAFTGMRSSELAHLRPQDVDLEGGWVHVVNRIDWQSKTRLSRQIPIHARLRPYLLFALKKSFRKPFLFCAPATAKFPQGDQPMSRHKLLDELQRLCAELKIPTGYAKDGFVVHSTRRFFRTHVTDATGHERAVDNWMGHVGRRTTGSVYYNLSPAVSQKLMKQVDFGAAAGSGSSSSKGASHAA